jgi:hypothetical protein
MDYGIKISKDGEDVKTCTEDELVFTSKRNYLKTPFNGTGTIAGAGTVAHGLGYVPVFFVCSRYTVGAEDRASSIGSFNWIYADTTNITFPTGSYKYYFFYNQAV